MTNGRRPCAGPHLWWRASGRSSLRREGPGSSSFLSGTCLTHESDFAESPLCGPLLLRTIEGIKQDKNDTPPWRGALLGRWQSTMLLRRPKPRRLGSLLLRSPAHARAEAGLPGPSPTPARLHASKASPGCTPGQLVPSHLGALGCPSASPSSQAAVQSLPPPHTASRAPSPRPSPRPFRSQSLAWDLGLEAHTSLFLCTQYAGVRSHRDGDREEGQASLIFSFPRGLSVSAPGGHLWGELMARRQWGGGGHNAGTVGTESWALPPPEAYKAWGGGTAPPKSPSARVRGPTAPVGGSLGTEYVCIIFLLLTGGLVPLFGTSQF